MHKPPLISLLENAFGAGGAQISIFLFLLYYVLAYPVAVFLLYSKVPKEHRKIPAWTGLLLLVPCINLIAYWLLIPFAIPGALDRWKDSGKKNEWGAIGQSNEVNRWPGLLAAVLHTGSLLRMAQIVAVPLGLLAHVVYLYWLWTSIKKLAAEKPPTIETPPT